jgi:S1-C subfamily serine protease
MKALSRCQYLIVSLLTIAASTSSAYAQSQGPGLSGFPAAVNRVLPCVVRVLGEATQEKIREHMAESVISADNKVYSVGSGFFISTDGRIITANHVVAPISGKIVIESRHTGKVTQHEAVILGQDDQADVALLKIEGKGYPKVEMLDPVTLPLGESIGFAGYPLNSPFPMVNKGIISAKVNMPLKDGLKARNLLVLNAFVNQGNSGGPLFLERTGEVIGLVNARKSADVDKRIIKLPRNYSPVLTLGGVDPIRLSVETYNSNLELIGDVSQFGIGYAASVEYILTLQKNPVPESKK